MNISHDEMMVSSQSLRETRRRKKSNIFSAKLATRVATWNVRTLSQAGKLQQLMREFKRYKLNILGISEARWKDSGKINCEGATFLFSGHDKQHIRGVGLVLDRETERAMIGWKPVNDRIITVRLQSRHAKTTLIQVYAPTEDTSEEDKDTFYEQLQDVLNEIPNHDIKVLMGDLNAKIDNKRDGFRDVVGPYGSARETNDNGERLLSFCSVNGLIIGNTQFQHKKIHKNTWRSPNGIIFNEIDYICISKEWRRAIKDVKSCRGADVGSDHYLVTAKIQLKLKVLKTQKVSKPFDVAKLKIESVREQLDIETTNKFQALPDECEVEEQWNVFKDVVLEAADKTIGKRRGSQKERWIRPETWNLIDTRRQTKINRDAADTSIERQQLSIEYSRIDKTVKKHCREDKRLWLESRCQEAQDASNRNDTRTLYRISRDLGGNNTRPNVPIKDKSGKVLQTEEEQNKRWVEHFREILNQPEPSEMFIFREEDDCPELNVETGTITEDEIEKSIHKLKNNKSPGTDQIPAELLKHGGTELRSKFTKLCNSCWRTQQVPVDWKKGAIVKLPKKGSLCECGNWRGITLLSVPGKVFCLVLLERLKAAVDIKIRTEQAGFRPGRSCNDQIFALRNIIEQCLEFQKNIVLNFIDFKKAFDSIHRETLWRILKSYGIPEVFVNIFKQLYEGCAYCIKTENGYTEYFDVVTGVRQGCILSPMLFIITIDYIMRKAMQGPQYGIKWDINRCLKDLDFADDLALIAESQHVLQDMTSSLEDTAAKVGLRISSEKTKIMEIGQPANTNSIIVNGIPVEKVNKFTYLGSVLTSDGEVETDINTRIGKAGSVFRNLQNIWKSNTITEKLKIKLLQTIVLPTCLYASETWKMSVKSRKKLDAFQQRCLRKILKITYRERITNEEVYRRTVTKPLSQTIEKSRMRYAGHVIRMSADRDPKVALKWRPEGRRRRGRPRLTWRRTFEQDLERRNVELDMVEEIANDRDAWRVLAAQCTQEYGRT